MFTSINDWKKHKNKLNENNTVGMPAPKSIQLADLLSDLTEAPENIQDTHLAELAKISNKWNNMVEDVMNGNIHLSYVIGSSFINTLDENEVNEAVEYLLKHRDPKITENTNTLPKIEEIYKLLKKSPNFDIVDIKSDNDNYYDRITYIYIKSKLYGVNSMHTEDLDEYDLGYVDGVLELHYIPNGHTQEIKSIDDLYMITRAFDSNESKVNEANGSFTKLKFNSNTWHNNECDILEGHLDSDSFITYGIYIKDSSSGKRKAGDEFMEYYKGENYVVGSKARAHSRVFGAENIPAKYKAKWNELKAIYEEKYKGKEHVKESSNVEEAYTFDFEEFMDTDLSGPSVESSITSLIDQFIDIANNEIDKEGAGTGANLDAVKKQAYRAIADVWKRNIDQYLLKGIKFNA